MDKPTVYKDKEHGMRIGIPKEIKTDEARVAGVPAGVYQFVEAGHEVFVEAGAGLRSGERRVGKEGR